MVQPQGTASTHTQYTAHWQHQTQYKASTVRTQTNNIYGNYAPQAENKMFNKEEFDKLMTYSVDEKDIKHDFQR